MATTDELRAAAERLSQFCDGVMPEGDGPDENDGYRMTGRYFEDVCRLVKAHCDANPADDAEPVTEEWLESSGWTRDEFDPDVHDVQTWSVREPGSHPDVEPIVVVADDGPLGWSAYFDGYDYDKWPRPLRTRDDVRRLLTALGISTPTEGT